MDLFSNDFFSTLWLFIQANQITLIAALINFLWVYLEYKASVWLWPVGIVLPIFYIIVSLQAHFYGNILINVYYLITSIIGWWMWLRRGESQGEGQIRALPKRAALTSLAIGLPLYGLLYLLIGYYTDSVMPWADALATAISFVGMIWLAKRWREHWLCWIAANALSAWIFYLAADFVSLVVFMCNFFIAILGYINWIKLSEPKANETLS